MSQSIKHLICSTTKQKKALFIKSVSLLIVFSFVLQDLSFANPELLKTDFRSWIADGGEKLRKKEDLMWAKKLLPAIPQSIASIEDAYQAPDSKNTIILVQDAHTNTSCQLNESKLFNILFIGGLPGDTGGEASIARRNEHDGVPQVAGPGYPNVPIVFTEAAQGNVNLTFLRDKASLSQRQQIAKEYIQKGLLHGIEYLDLTSDHHFKIEGVEEPALYFESLDVYKRSVKKRASFEQYLNEIESTIDFLKSKLLNPFLFSFLETKDKQKDSLPDYIKTLISQANTLNINLSKYPNLQRLNEIDLKEKEVNFEEAQKEQAAFLATLPKEEQQDLLKASRSKDEQVKKGFFLALQEKLSVGLATGGAKGGLPLRGVYEHSGIPQRQAPSQPSYPNLVKYLSYFKSSQALNPKDILKEQKDLEGEVLKALTTNEDEEKLLLSIKTLAYYKKLFYLSLTPEEYEASKDQKFTDLKVLSGFLNEKLMNLRDRYDKAIFLKEDFTDMQNLCKRFYELTYERDKAFLSNMLKEIRSTQHSAGGSGGEASIARRNEHDGVPQLTGPAETLCILITGGYHTPNLKYLLKQHNLSYISIIPQILQETNVKRYEEILLSQPITSSSSPVISRAPQMSMTAYPAGTVIAASRLSAKIIEDLSGAGDPTFSGAMSESVTSPKSVNGARLASERELVSMTEMTFLEYAEAMKANIVPSKIMIIRKNGEILASVAVRSIEWSGTRTLGPNPVVTRGLPHTLHYKIGDNEYEIKAGEIEKIMVPGGKLIDLVSRWGKNLRLGIDWIIHEIEASPASVELVELSLKKLGNVLFETDSKFKNNLHLFAMTRSEREDKMTGEAAAELKERITKNYLVLLETLGKKLAPGDFHETVKELILKFDKLKSEAERARGDRDVILRKLKEILISEGDQYEYLVLAPLALSVKDIRLYVSLPETGDLTSEQWDKFISGAMMLLFINSESDPSLAAIADLGHGLSAGTYAIYTGYLDIPWVGPSTSIILSAIGKLGGQAARLSSAARLAGKVGVVTSASHERPNDNQDSHLVMNLRKGELELYLIADGAGGYGYGRKASQAAVHSIQAYVEGQINDLSHKSVSENWILEQLLVPALYQADGAVSQGATTATLVLVWKQADGSRKVYTVQQGDSRAYLDQGGQLAPLAIDNVTLNNLDSSTMRSTADGGIWGLIHWDTPLSDELKKLLKIQNDLEKMNNLGRATKVQNFQFSNRNWVENILGRKVREEGDSTELYPIVFVKSIPAGVSSRIVLASDGVTDNLTTERIQEVLRKGGSQQEIAEALHKKSAEVETRLIEEVRPFFGTIFQFFKEKFQENGPVFSKIHFWNDQSAVSNFLTSTKLHYLAGLSSSVRAVSGIMILEDIASIERFLTDPEAYHDDKLPQELNNLPDDIREALLKIKNILYTTEWVRAKPDDMTVIVAELAPAARVFVPEASQFKDWTEDTKPAEGLFLRDPKSGDIFLIVSIEGDQIKRVRIDPFGGVKTSTDLFLISSLKNSFQYAPKFLRESQLKAIQDGNFDTMISELRQEGIQWLYNLPYDHAGLNEGEKEPGDHTIRTLLHLSTDSRSTAKKEWSQFLAWMRTQHRVHGIDAIYIQPDAGHFNVNASVLAAGLNENHSFEAESGVNSHFQWRKNGSTLDILPLSAARLAQRRKFGHRAKQGLSGGQADRIGRASIKNDKKFVEASQAYRVLRDAYYLVSGVEVKDDKLFLSARIEELDRLIQGAKKIKLVYLSDVAESHYKAILRDLYLNRGIVNLNLAKLANEEGDHKKAELYYESAVSDLRQHETRSDHDSNYWVLAWTDRAANLYDAAENLGVDTTRNILNRGGAFYRQQRANGLSGLRGDLKKITNDAIADVTTLRNILRNAGWVATAARLANFADVKAQLRQVAESLLIGKATPIASSALIERSAGILLVGDEVRYLPLPGEVNDKFQVVPDELLNQAKTDASTGEKIVTLFSSYTGYPSLAALETARALGLSLGTVDRDGFIRIYQPRAGQTQVLPDDFMMKILRRIFYKGFGPIEIQHLNRIGISEKKLKYTWDKQVAQQWANTLRLGLIEAVGVDSSDRLFQNLERQFAKEIGIFFNLGLIRPDLIPVGTPERQRAIKRFNADLDVMEKSFYPTMLKAVHYASELAVASKADNLLTAVDIPDFTAPWPVLLKVEAPKKAAQGTLSPDVAEKKLEKEITERVKQALQHQLIQKTEEVEFRDFLRVFILNFKPVQPGIKMNYENIQKAWAQRAEEARALSTAREMIETFIMDRAIAHQGAPKPLRRWVALGNEDVIREFAHIWISAEMEERYVASPPEARVFPDENEFLRAMEAYKALNSPEVERAERVARLLALLDLPEDAETARVQEAFVPVDKALTLGIGEAAEGKLSSEQHKDLRLKRNVVLENVTRRVLVSAQSQFEIANDLQKPLEFEAITGEKERIAEALLLFAQDVAPADRQPLQEMVQRLELVSEYRVELARLTEATTRVNDNSTELVREELQRSRGVLAGPDSLVQTAWKQSLDEARRQVAETFVLQITEAQVPDAELAGKLPKIESAQSMLRQVDASLFAGGIATLDAHKGRIRDRIQFLAKQTESSARNTFEAFLKKPEPAQEAAQAFLDHKPFNEFFDDPKNNVKEFLLAVKIGIPSNRLIKRVRGYAGTAKRKRLAGDVSRLVDAVEIMAGHFENTDAARLARSEASQLKGERQRLGSARKDVMRRLKNANDSDHDQLLESLRNLDDQIKVNKEALESLQRIEKRKKGRHWLHGTAHTVSPKSPFAAVFAGSRNFRGIRIHHRYEVDREYNSKISEVLLDRFGTPIYLRVFSPGGRKRPLYQKFFKRIEIHYLQGRLIDVVLAAKDYIRSGILRKIFSVLKKGESLVTTRVPLRKYRKNYAFMTGWIHFSLSGEHYPVSRRRQLLAEVIFQKKTDDSQEDPQPASVRIGYYASDRPGSEDNVRFVPLASYDLQKISGVKKESYRVVPLAARLAITPPLSDIDDHDLFYGLIPRLKIASDGINFDISEARQLLKMRSDGQLTATSLSTWISSFPKVQPRDVSTLNKMVETVNNFFGLPLRNPDQIRRYVPGETASARSQGTPGFFEGNVHIIYSSHGQDGNGREAEFYGRKVAEELDRVLVEAQVSPEQPVVLWVEQGAPMNFASKIEDMQKLFEVADQGAGRGDSLEVFSKWWQEDAHRREIIRWLQNNYRRAVQEEMSQRKVAYDDFFRTSLLDWASRGRKVTIATEVVPFEAFEASLLSKLWILNSANQLKHGDADGAATSLYFGEYHLQKNIELRDSALSKEMQSVIAANPKTVHIVVRGSGHHSLSKELTEDGLKISEHKLPIYLMHEVHLEDRPLVFPFTLPAESKSDVYRSMIQNLVSSAHHLAAPDLSIELELEWEDRANRLMSNLSPEQLDDWANKIGKQRIDFEKKSEATLEWLLRMYPDLRNLPSGSVLFSAARLAGTLSEKEIAQTLLEPLRIASDGIRFDPEEVIHLLRMNIRNELSVESLSAWLRQFPKVEPRSTEKLEAMIRIFKSMSVSITPHPEAGITYTPPAMTPETAGAIREVLNVFKKTAWKHQNEWTLTRVINFSKTHHLNKKVNVNADQVLGVALGIKAVIEKKNDAPDAKKKAYDAAIEMMGEPAALLKAHLMATFAGYYALVWNEDHDRNDLNDKKRLNRLVLKNFAGALDPWLLPAVEEYEAKANPIGLPTREDQILFLNAYKNLNDFFMPSGTLLLIQRSTMGVFQTGPRDIQRIRLNDRWGWGLFGRFFYGGKNFDALHNLAGGHHPELNLFFVNVGKIGTIADSFAGVFSGNSVESANRRIIIHAFSYLLSLQSDQSRRSLEISDEDIENMDRLIFELYQKFAMGYQDTFTEEGHSEALARAIAWMTYRHELSHMASNLLNLRAQYSGSANPAAEEELLATLGELSSYDRNQPLMPYYSLTHLLLNMIPSELGDPNDPDINEILRTGIVLDKILGSTSDIVSKNTVRDKIKEILRQKDEILALTPEEIASRSEAFMQSRYGTGPVWNREAEVVSPMNDLVERSKGLGGYAKVPVAAARLANVPNAPRLPYRRINQQINQFLAKNVVEERFLGVALLLGDGSAKNTMDRIKILFDLMRNQRPQNDKINAAYSIALFLLYQDLFYTLSMIEPHFPESGKIDERMREIIDVFFTAFTMHGYASPSGPPGDNYQEKSILINDMFRLFKADLSGILRKMETFRTGVHRKKWFDLGAQMFYAYPGDARKFDHLNAEFADPAWNSPSAGWIRQWLSENDEKVMSVSPNAVRGMIDFYARLPEIRKSYPSMIQEIDALSASELNHLITQELIRWQWPIRPDDGGWETLLKNVKNEDNPGIQAMSLWHFLGPFEYFYTDVEGAMAAENIPVYFRIRQFEAFKNRLSPGGEPIRAYVKVAYAAARYLQIAAGARMAKEVQRNLFQILRHDSSEVYKRKVEFKKLGFSMDTLNRYGEENVLILLSLAPLTAQERSHISFPVTIKKEDYFVIKDTLQKIENSWLPFKKFRAKKMVQKLIKLVSSPSGIKPLDEPARVFFSTHGEAGDPEAVTIRRAEQITKELDGELEREEIGPKRPIVLWLEASLGASSWKMYGKGLAGFENLVQQSLGIKDPLNVLVSSILHPDYGRIVEFALARHKVSWSEFILSDVMPAISSHAFSRTIGKWATLKSSFRDITIATEIEPAEALLDDLLSQIWEIHGNLAFREGDTDRAVIFFHNSIMHRRLSSIARDNALSSEMAHVIKQVPNAVHLVIRGVNHLSGFSEALDKAKIQSRTYQMPDLENLPSLEFYYAQQHKFRIFYFGDRADIEPDARQSLLRIMISRYVQHERNKIQFASGEKMLKVLDSIDLAVADISPGEIDEWVRSIANLRSNSLNEKTLATWNWLLTKRPVLSQIIQDSKLNTSKISLPTAARLAAKPGQGQDTRKLAETIVDFYYHVSGADKTKAKAFHPRNEMRMALKRGRPMSADVISGWPSKAGIFELGEGEVVSQKMGHRTITLRLTDAFFAELWPILISPGQEDLVGKVDKLVQKYNSARLAKESKPVEASATVASERVHLSDFHVLPVPRILSSQAKLKKIKMTDVSALDLASAEEDPLPFYEKYIREVVIVKLRLKLADDAAEEKAIAHENSGTFSHVFKVRTIDPDGKIKYIAIKIAGGLLGFGYRAAENIALDVNTAKNLKLKNRVKMFAAFYSNFQEEVKTVSLPFLVVEEFVDGADLRLAAEKGWISREQTASQVLTAIQEAGRQGFTLWDLQLGSNTEPFKIVFQDDAPQLIFFDLGAFSNDNRLVAAFNDGSDQAAERTRTVLQQIDEVFGYDSGIEAKGAQLAAKNRIADVGSRMAENESTIHDPSSKIRGARLSISAPVMRFLANVFLAVSPLVSGERIAIADEIYTTNRVGNILYVKTQEGVSVRTDLNKHSRAGAATGDASRSVTNSEDLTDDVQVIHHANGLYSPAVDLGSPKVLVLHLDDFATGTPKLIRRRMENILIQANGVIGSKTVIVLKGQEANLKIAYEIIFTHRLKTGQFTRQVPAGYEGVVPVHLISQDGRDVIFDKEYRIILKADRDLAHAGVFSYGSITGVLELIAAGDLGRAYELYKSLAPEGSAVRNIERAQFDKLIAGDPQMRAQFALPPLLRVSFSVAMKLYVISRTTLTNA